MSSFLDSMRSNLLVLLTGCIIAFFVSAQSFTPTDVAWMGGTATGEVSPAGGYSAVGGDFDDVATWFERDGDLTGNADDTAGTISVWFKCDGSDGEDQCIYYNTGGYVVLKKQTGNNFRLQLTDPNTVRARLDQNTAVVPAFTAAAGWHHIVASWDVATETKHHLYIDGTNCETTAIFVSGDVDGDADNVDYTRAEHYIGNDGGTGGWDGCLSEFYFSYTYYDLSQEANLNQFYNASGPPQDLSSIGSPIIYFKGAWTEATIANSGSGGDFNKKGTNSIDACNP